MAAHEIFVSNIGCICRTENHAEAQRAFVDAVALQQARIKFVRQLIEEFSAKEP